MGAMSPMHWLIVVGVLVLLFGAKKLPDMARSIGQSARVFKGEMKDLRDDGTPDGTVDPVGGDPEAVESPAPTAVRERTADNPTRADTAPTDSPR